MKKQLILAVIVPVFSLGCYSIKSTQLPDVHVEDDIVFVPLQIEQSAKQHLLLSNSEYISLIEAIRSLPEFRQETRIDVIQIQPVSMGNVVIKVQCYSQRGTYEIFVRLNANALEYEVITVVGPSLVNIRSND